MFNNFFRGDIQDEDSAIMAWTPAVDIAEHDDEYLVKVELPGVNKEDVKITIESNVLTIREKRNRKRETKKENYHRVERNYGSFQRSFTLPSTVKSEKIDASYKDGILSVSLPKAEEAKRNK